MDAKDLRTESTLGDRSNDGNSKYPQGSAVLQCNRNKPYQDMGSNSLAKVDVQTARPCAVIGPDRVVPPSASTDVYLKMKKSPLQPWPGADIYRRPPEYPQKIHEYHHPTRNISPRQTFQENMQRIMVPPSYSSAKTKEDHNFPVDPNFSSLRNNKLNVPTEAKYCDVPYANEQKNIRNTEINVSNMNPVLARGVPHGWPPGNVNIRSSKPYGVPEMFQYPDYSSCAGPRPMLMQRPHRTISDEPGHAYTDPYYHEGNLRFKPYPPVKERLPQARYEYLSNYPNAFHPPAPFPTHKYDLQKSIPSHPYSGYSQVPLKYLDNRMAEPIMNGYQRPLNQPANFNTVPFRNQVIHPGYGPVPSNCLQGNKFYPYPPDNSIKALSANKISYDNNNKMYAEYENARAKAYPVPESFYVNEMTRQHPMKGQVLPPNYSSVNMQHAMPPHPYYRKENPIMKNYDYSPHFRNMDPSLIGNTLSRLPSQFSPDSNTSNDTTQTQGTLQEDCGYVSQSSSTSMRSVDSSINRIPNDFYRRYDYRYGPAVKSSPMMYKPDLNPHNNVNSKNKKDIDVRQFLQMWNEGEDESGENNKDISVKSISSANDISKHYEASSQEQLYVLGLVNVPSEELSKYEHIQKVSKLPENIKGYNGIELLNQFEEVIQSSNMKNFNNKPTTRGGRGDFHVSLKGSPSLHGISIPSRPLSPLDVESKISQSVIHKEVGCNFEIKPCSPKMLNVEVAAPAQNVLGERVIEKVSNPLLTPSPILHGVDEKMDNCDVNKRQDRRIPANETTKVPSCKMVNTQYDTVDSVKTNYSVQDLESSSGVCLASLPRLDNDIELNFPEVNQQFINANKTESVIDSMPKDLPALDLNPSDSVQNQTKQKVQSDQYSSNIENEKEVSKLSKYRKLKRKGVTEESNAEHYAQAMRINSVIIKNPDNIKTYDETEEHINPPIKKIAQDIQQAPINLTVHTEEHENAVVMELHSEKNVENKPNIENIINFSLNSNDDCELKSVVRTTKSEALIEFNDDILKEKDLGISYEGRSRYNSKNVLQSEKNINMPNILEDNNGSTFEEKEIDIKVSKDKESFDVIGHNNELNTMSDSPKNIRTPSIRFDSGGTKNEADSQNHVDKSSSIHDTPRGAFNFIANRVTVNKNETEHLFDELAPMNSELTSKTALDGQEISTVIDKKQSLLLDRKCEQYDNEYLGQTISDNREGECDKEFLSETQVNGEISEMKVYYMENAAEREHTPNLDCEHLLDSIERNCDNISFAPEKKSNCFYKGMLSPWIQKLILYNKGFCTDLQDKSQLVSIFPKVPDNANSEILENDDSVHSKEEENLESTVSSSLPDVLSCSSHEIVINKESDELATNRLKVGFLDETMIENIITEKTSGDIKTYYDGESMAGLETEIETVSREIETKKGMSVTVLENTVSCKLECDQCTNTDNELISEEMNNDGFIEKSSKNAISPDSDETFLNNTTFRPTLKNKNPDSDLDETTIDKELFESTSKEIQTNKNAYGTNSCISLIPENIFSYSCVEDDNVTDTPTSETHAGPENKGDVTQELKHDSSVDESNLRNPIISKMVAFDSLPDDNTDDFTSKSTKSSIENNAIDTADRKAISEKTTTNDLCESNIIHNTLTDINSETADSNLEDPLVNNSAFFDDDMKIYDKSGDSILETYKLNSCIVDRVAVHMTQEFVSDTTEGHRFVDDMPVDDRSCQIVKSNNVDSCTDGTMVDNVSGDVISATLGNQVSDIETNCCTVDTIVDLFLRKPIPETTPYIDDVTLDKNIPILETTELDYSATETVIDSNRISVATELDSCVDDAMISNRSTNEITDSIKTDIGNSIVDVMIKAEKPISDITEISLSDNRDIVATIDIEKSKPVHQKRKDHLDGALFVGTMQKLKSESIEQTTEIDIYDSDGTVCASTSETTEIEHCVEFEIIDDTKKLTCEITEPETYIDDIINKVDCLISTNTENDHYGSQVSTQDNTQKTVSKVTEIDLAIDDSVSSTIISGSTKVISYVDMTMNKLVSENSENKQVSENSDNEICVNNNLTTTNIRDESILEGLIDNVCSKNNACRDVKEIKSNISTVKECNHSYGDIDGKNELEINLCSESNTRIPGDNDLYQDGFDRTEPAPSNHFDVNNSQLSLNSPSNSLFEDNTDSQPKDTAKCFVITDDDNFKGIASNKLDDEHHGIFTNNLNDSIKIVNTSISEVDDTCIAPQDEIIEGYNVNEIDTADQQLCDSYKHTRYRNNYSSIKSRTSLKRSLSDSALDTCDTDFHDKHDSENRPLLWPNKRKKVTKPDNITQPRFITEEFCNIIHHNRRNSISSVYNEENISFCILIDNNCIITEDGEETEKICFTEITEDSMSCTPAEEINENESTGTATEIISFQEEISYDYSNSFAQDTVEEDKSIEPSWVEDVACVETVVSDDIAEDVVVSASSSPNNTDVSDDESNNNDLTIFDVNHHTDKVKYIYGDKMCSNDAELVETLYRTPQMDVNKTLVYRESHVTNDCNRYYDTESLEQVLSESNTNKVTLCNVDDGAFEAPLNPQVTEISKGKGNLNLDTLNSDSFPFESERKHINIISQTECAMSEENILHSQITQDHTVHSCESSVDNVFSYNQRDESPKCSISNSPEVSSTTSEERNSTILLKITNYGGSRIAHVNDNDSDTKRNTVSCKYTEKKDYINSNTNLPVRPLITKAAQKYIPPLKETIRDLKVKLPLSENSLIKLKQLKVSKEEPKSNTKRNKQNVVKTDGIKKSKPKFEDVLKSIDEIQFKMHKEKNKKIKRAIPKVVIKKNENGSHYASTSNKDKYNPDLTGRKWQPWVFIEKDAFIDKMALRNKTRAIFNYRKNTYVLAETFKKYKSVGSANQHHQSFFISQPKSNDSRGQLKYTIRLKHSY